MFIQGATSRTEGTGMHSADGESIDFINNIVLEGPVELWLCKIGKHFFL